MLSDGSPVGIAFYESPATRVDLIESIRIVAEVDVTETTNVEDAFVRKDELLVLSPENEVDAVRTLDGRREALRDRTAPVVLLLLRGGDAESALRNSPSLASWVRNAEYDPRPAALDLESEARRFHEATSMTPREWLEHWRAGRIDDTLEANLLYQRALLHGDER